MATTYTALGCTNPILERFDPEDALAAIERERATTCLLVPTMLNALLNAPTFGDHDLSSLRLVFYGGGPMPLPVLRRAIEAIGCSFTQGYGLTETIEATFLTSADHALDGEPARERRLASAGREAVNAEVRVVDDDGADLGPGELGEILIRSPSVIREYWRAPEATAAAIRDGWFHTGDIGHRDEDGYLFVVDRKKDVIISGGENVYPKDVEDVLYTHPAVVEAAVIGTPGRALGRARHRRRRRRASRSRPRSCSNTAATSSRATNARARCASSTRCRATPAARSSSASCERHEPRGPLGAQRAAVPRQARVRDGLADGHLRRAPRPRGRARRRPRRPRRPARRPDRRARPQLPGVPRPLRRRRDLRLRRRAAELPPHPRGAGRDRRRPRPARAALPGGVRRRRSRRPAADGPRGRHRARRGRRAARRGRRVPDVDERDDGDAAGGDAHPRRPVGRRAGAGARAAAEPGGRPPGDDAALPRRRARAGALAHAARLHRAPARGLRRRPGRGRHRAPPDHDHPGRADDDRLAAGRDAAGPLQPAPDLVRQRADAGRAAAARPGALRADLRAGLRADRERPAGHRAHARGARPGGRAARQRRPRGPGRRGPDRGRRDPDPQPVQHDRLLAQPGADRGGRCATAGCTPATSAGSTSAATCTSSTARRT